MGQIQSTVAGAQDSLAENPMMGALVGGLGGTALSALSGGKTPAELLLGAALGGGMGFGATKLFKKKKTGEKAAPGPDKNDPLARNDAEIAKLVGSSVQDAIKAVASGSQAGANAMSTFAANTPVNNATFR